jgi:hypothetical protein
MSDISPGSRRRIPMQNNNQNFADDESQRILDVLQEDGQDEDDVMLGGG